MKRIIKLLTVAALGLGSAALVGCSDNTIVLPFQKPPAPSKEITAQAYMEKGMYVCPVPLPPIKKNPNYALDNMNMDKPHSSSTADLSQYLCYQGVVIYHEGDTPHIVVPADLIFLSNSSQMRYQVEPILDSIATLIKRSGSNNVNIGTYTDVILPKQQALALSKEQAKAVQTYLWGQGVPMQCMTAQGYGTGMLIGSAWTQAGNAANRRIEISY